MRNKKGFTLVELLAVLVIIGVIATITFTTVNKNLKISKEKAFDVQISNLKDATMKWISSNDKALGEYNLNTICVSIKDLQDSKFIEPGVIKNPKTKKELKGKIEVYFDADKNAYNYEYKEDCESKIINPIYETVVNNNKDSIKVSGDDDGLYETISEYVFRGDNPSNYIQFGNQKWRILDFNKDTKEARIIRLDDNQIMFSNKLLEDLNDEYTDSSIYSSIKDYIKTNSKINNGSFDELGSYELIKSIESSTTDYKTVSLLNVTDYMNASLGNDCYDKGNCSEKNYLNTKKSSGIYLLNSNISSDKNWYINSDGYIELASQNEALRNAYPVLTLKLSAEISSGTGTNIDPYIIK